MTTQQDLLEQYDRNMLPVFGTPPLVLTRGDGCYVWDADGTRYLDLVGGIAVNALGHNHPALVAAVSKQVGEAIHVSNLFTTPAQIELAGRLLEVAGAPSGSKVFFTNSGTESIEAAIKLARRTGRTGIVATSGAFHGRSTGALALTHKAIYREPFEPLLPGVRHVPYDDVDALREAVTDEVGAVVLEPIQGEAGVVVPFDGYLAAARAICTAAGALLIVDEIQTGIGRTGDWFGFQQSGIQPDAITVAKGLGGGVPAGALVTFGDQVSSLLTKGQHGTTFGGNPLACAAGLAVLNQINDDHLLAHAGEMEQQLRDAIAALGRDDVVGVRGRGLLLGVELANPVSAEVAERMRIVHHIIVNPVAPQVIRLAPPLIVSADQLGSFVTALGTVLEEL